MKKDYNYLLEKYPDNRNEGKSDMENIHHVLLRILKIFDEICKDYNLKYFLDSGTLLGAIRHNGFIPWDDDLDVAMPREDYEKFKSIAKDVLPDGYFFQCKDTVPTFKNNIIRIVDRKSTATAKGKKASDYSWHMGLFFDIFPMDYTNHPKLAKRIKQFFYYDYKNSFIKFILKLIRHLFVFIIGKQNIIKFAKYCFSFGKNKKYLCYGFELDWSPYYSVDEVFPLRTKSFEGFNTFIPNNTDSVLNKCFGDYMKIPEPKDRISHFQEVLFNTKCDFEVNDKQAKYQ